MNLRKVRELKKVHEFVKVHESGVKFMYWKMFKNLEKKITNPKKKSLKNLGISSWIWKQSSWTHFFFMHFKYSCIWKKDSKCEKVHGFDKGKRKRNNALMPSLQPCPPSFLPQWKTTLTSSPPSPYTLFVDMVAVRRRPETLLPPPLFSAVRVHKMTPITICSILVSPLVPVAHPVPPKVAHIYTPPPRLPLLLA